MDDGGLGKRSGGDHGALAFELDVGGPAGSAEIPPWPFLRAGFLKLDRGEHHQKNSPNPSPPSRTSERPGFKEISSTSSDRRHAFYLWFSSDVSLQMMLAGRGWQGERWSKACKWEDLGVAVGNSARFISLHDDLVQTHSLAGKDWTKPRRLQGEVRWLGGETSDGRRDTLDQSHPCLRLRVAGGRESALVAGYRGRGCELG
jgi:hypothetical protein